MFFLAGLINFFGPDLLIILATGLVSALIAGFVLRTRNGKGGNTVNRSLSSPEQRLQKLNAMRQGGLISEKEYEEQRQRVIREI